MKEKDPVPVLMILSAVGVMVTFAGAYGDNDWGVFGYWPAVGLGMWVLGLGAMSAVPFANKEHYYVEVFLFELFSTVFVFALRLDRQSAIHLDPGAIAGLWSLGLVWPFLVHFFPRGLQAPNDSSETLLLATLKGGALPGRKRSQRRRKRDQRGK